MVSQTQLTELLEQLHRDMADKARDLSELDLMLEDYQTERLKLIHELRWLQARALDVKEQLQQSRPT